MAENSTAVCERCIIWAKLNFAHVNIPVPLPEEVVLAVLDDQFKAKTIQAHGRLDTKNFGPETLEAALAVGRTVATWEVSDDTDYIFRTREAELSSEDFYLLCVYLLYRSHDALHGGNMSPLSQNALDAMTVPVSPTAVPSSPIATLLNDRKHGRMQFEEDGDTWGYSNSQEELDDYTRSCAYADEEVGSPMASHLARRKKVISQCRDIDRFDPSTADNSTDDGSVSPMGAAMRHRNAHQEEDALISSPMASKLQLRKKQMANMEVSEDPDFFFSHHDEIGSPVQDGVFSPMTRAMDSIVRCNLDEKLGEKMFSPDVNQYKRGRYC